MAYLASGFVIRQLGTLFEGGSVAGLSDRQLLERFTAQRDDAAFAALVTRHGPMVLGVCRQLLHDRHHAEDAFQAVFLVLARKAHSIREPDLLGNWLYGVALRTARCARLQLDRRRKSEEARPRSRPASTDPPAIDREQAQALHDEIDRLPNAFRLPVVLCYFEGLTVLEAAQRLGWPHGTVRSRLARAREKLRRGLIRRGVVPATALAAVLDSRPASASVSFPLCDITTRAAIHFAAGHTAAPSAAALAQEVVKSMLIHKSKSLALTLLFLGAVATGAGFLTHALAMKDEPRKVPAAPQSKPDDAPAPGRMFVVGRVLDPQDKPRAGVPVDIVGRSREQFVAARGLSGSQRLLGRGATDGDGQFRLDASRSSSESFFEVHALASVPGFGLGWAQLNADAGQPAAEIRLRPEQLIRGKLVDINGQPAAGVELRIASVGRPSDIGTFDGVNMGNFPTPEGLRAWPRPVTTDNQGRFTFTGIGRDVTVSFNTRDLRFASQGFRIQTDVQEGPKVLTLALTPATIVEGRALTADTGQPIPHAIVNVASGQNELRMAGARFLADDRGRYTANVAPGEFYRIQAFPPEGPPYLVTRHDFAWAKGAVKTVMDVKLRRGAIIRGKVTEQGTDRPIARATVQYKSARGPNDVTDGYTAVVASKDDGSYQIVVSPGKGHLFVYGPSSDYLLEAIGGRMIYSGQPGGERYYAHDIIAYDVQAGDSPHELNAVLRSGKTIKGRLVGPDGQTVENAEIIAVLHFNYFHLNWRGDLTRHVRNGRFALHGLDPEQATRVSFLDADHQWGATVDFSGKQAGEEVTVRLQPCGTARARFVGPDGKPLARRSSHLELLGTSGPHHWDLRPESKSQLAADAVSVVNLDRKHYWHGPLSDAEGRLTLPDLIPGVTYRIYDSSTMNVENLGAQVRKDFTVKPGETLDLGDIRIEKPQA